MHTRSVAFVLPGLRRGGAELSTVRLAEGLANLKYRVSVVSVLRDAAEMEGISSDLVKFYSLEAPRIGLSLFRISKFISSWKPDIIVTTQPHISIALTALRTVGMKYTGLVCVEHAPLVEQATRMRTLKYRVLPRLASVFYPKADAVVTVSKGIAEELNIIAPRIKRMKVIYNPLVDASLIERASSKLVPAYPDQAKRLTVLAVGRLSPEKDFSTLLRAFSIFKKRFDARLVILGDGPMRKELYAEAEKLEISAHLFMPGFVENPMPFMADASVLAGSSQYEGFGNVLVEAMACGTQVVSTDAPTGPREILEGGKWGRLVPVGDAAALAEAMGQAVEFPIDPASLRLRAASFSVSASISQYEALFREIFAETDRVS